VIDDRARNYILLVLSLLNESAAGEVFSFSVSELPLTEPLPGCESTGLFFPEVHEAVKIIMASNNLVIENFIFI
jgi:hypothetical protein